MEDSADEDGKEAVEGEAEEGSAEGKDDEGAHSVTTTYEADALFHACEDRLGGFGGDELHLDHEERDDDGDVGDAVEGEAPGRAQRGVGEAADGGADDTREIELDGVHRDGVREVLRADEGGQKRRVGRTAEGLADSDEEAEREDVPDLYEVQGEEGGEQEGADHLDVLGGKQHLAAIHAIGKDASKEREHHDGKLAEEEVEAEVEGVFGEVVDEPALGELLDEGADGGDAGSYPHQPEVTVAEGSEDACKKLRATGHSGYGSSGRTLVRGYRSIVQGWMNGGG